MNVKAWNKGDDNATVYLRLEEDSNGTVLLTVCDKEGNRLERGVLMRIGSNGFCLGAGATDMPSSALDERRRLMQQNAFSDVCPPA